MIATNKWGTYSIPDSVSYTYPAKTIIEGGVHEDVTIEYLRSIGKTIIHSGGGFGDFLPALRDCDKVFVFEPNQLMYQSLCETIRLNSLTNIEISPKAIGNHDGFAFLKTVDQNGLEMGPRSEVAKSGDKVEMVKLDSIIPKDCEISVIHLDLEGYEFEALRGASEIINRDKPIIILEIDQRAVDYNNFMESIDYRPYKQLIYNSSERMVFVNTVYVPKVDSEYWKKDLPHPLSPSKSDVEIYKQFMTTGTTLLLGLTKSLMDISDFQMDLDPWIKSKSVITGDWKDNSKYYDNIIGDGVLSFTKELADNLIEMAKSCCEVFICRTFTQKLPIMRIADNFPKPEDFNTPPNFVIERPNYSFYIWKF